jgi:predicted neuraminidase
MEKETNDKVAVAMVDAAQNKFPNLQGCSFDKSHAQNQVKMSKISKKYFLHIKKTLGR